MKAFTRLLYLFIFIFSAIYVFKHEKYSKRVEILNGYPVNFSVNRGNDLEFYLNPRLNHKKGIVCIYDTGHRIVDSLVLNLIKQPDNKDTLLYERGYSYINKFTYNTSKLKSGIYLIGNVVPFLVKEPQLKNSITVVFPFANFMALSNEGGKSFDQANSSHGVAATKLSLNRSLWTSNNPLAFIHWMDSTYSAKSVNYISDLDLDAYANIQQTKVLIVYGYSGFWTNKQKNNFEQFINEGGNALAICSYLMNNKYDYNADNNQISFKNVQFKNEACESTVSGINKMCSNLSIIGCSYETGYNIKIPEVSYGGFKIINNLHPLFQSVTDSIIALDNSNSNSIAVENINFRKYPQALPDPVNFYSKKILAYDYSIQNDKQTITGIFLMEKKENSGKLIIIGNEKWCWKNYFYTKSIQTITKNCIQQLVTN